MTKTEIEDIETMVLLHLQKTEDFVRARSRNWLIAGGAALVLFIVLAVVIFKRQPKQNDAYVNQIQTLDSLVHYQQTTINALEKVNEGQDSIISTLNEKLKNNRTTETRIIHSYEQIPNSVHSLSKDSLRRAITGFE
jgi:LPS O-antigen subunit length determinant protein (WzzB/FepE family)